MHINAPKSVTRRWGGLLYCAVVACVTACGGGSDDRQSEPQGGAGLEATAGNARMQRADASSAAAGASAPAQRRKARAYDAKGVTALSVAPDGGTVAIATADGKVSVVDAASVVETKLLKGTGGPPSAGLVFSGDGAYVVSVGRDSVAQVWRVQTGERRFSLNGHEQPLRSVAANADASIIATAGEETRVMLWDGATGRLKRVLGGAADFINTLAMSPDGRWLAAGGADARVLVWDVATARLLGVLRGHADEIAALAFSADGTLLASAGRDGKVLLWDIASGSQVKGPEAPGVPVRSLTFDRDGGLLVGGAEDGSVVLWSSRTFAVALQLAGSGSAITTVAFDPKNKNRLWAGDQQGRLLSWIVPASVGK